MMEEFLENYEDIRAFPCLSGLDEEEMGIIAQGAEIRTYQRGETIFIESEAINSFFIVKSGTVKLFKTSHDGKELILNIMKEGEHFCFLLPEVATAHVVSAAAVEDTSLLMIKAEDFMQLLNRSLGPLGLKIIEGLCCRIKMLSNMINDLAFKNVDQRVADTLLRLIENEPEGEDSFFLRLSHQNIASLVGTVREVVSRSISRLKKEGVIFDSTPKGFRLSRARLTEFLKSTHTHTCK